MRCGSTTTDVANMYVHGHISASRGRCMQALTRTVKSRSGSMTQASPMRAFVVTCPYPSAPGRM